MLQRRINERLEALNASEQAYSIVIKESDVIRRSLHLTEYLSMAIELECEIPPNSKFKNVADKVDKVSKMHQRQWAKMREVVRQAYFASVDERARYSKALSETIGNTGAQRNAELSIEQDDTIRTIVLPNERTFLLYVPNPVVVYVKNTKGSEIVFDPILSIGVTNITLGSNGLRTAGKVVLHHLLELEFNDRFNRYKISSAAQAKEGVIRE